MEVRAIGKRYGALRALEGVSFTVRAGEMLAVIGPNGAGKTTLLSILAGAQRPSSGSVTPGAASVGWAPQQQAVYSRLSENLELFARLEKVPDPRAAVERMLEQTGLRARSRELVGRLSGGNRQRVNVALALIADPPVLVLDEPSASLDPPQRVRLWEFVCGLARAGTAVVFSTHYVAEAQRLADRVLVLVDGRVAIDAVPEQVERAGGGGGFEAAFLEILRRAPEPAPAPDGITDERGTGP